MTPFNVICRNNTPHPQDPKGRFPNLKVGEHYTVTGEGVGVYENGDQMVGYVLQGFPFWIFEKERFELINQNTKQMIQFKENERVFSHDEAIYRALVAYAQWKGVPLADPSILDPKDWGSYPYILYHNGKLYPANKNYGSCVEITIDGFLTRCDNHVISLVTLTEEYNAQLDVDGIHVGCQLITWKKFDELVGVAKTWREKNEKAISGRQTSSHGQ